MKKNVEGHFFCARSQIKSERIEEDLIYRAERARKEMNKITVAKSITAPAKIETAIERAKATLTARAKKYGLYENFGDAEIRAIEGKYIDLSDFYNEMLKQKSKFKQFVNWCQNYQMS